MSPYVCQQVMEPIMVNLTGEFKGIQAYIYYDDMIILANDYKTCANAGRFLVDTLERLGMKINKEKSSKVPT